MNLLNDELTIKCPVSIFSRIGITGSYRLQLFSLLDLHFVFLCFVGFYLDLLLQENM